MLVGNVVWVAWNLPRGLLSCCGCFATHLRLCETSSLALGGGVGFGDLPFFAACCGFGDGCGLGTTRGFDTLGGCGARGFFGLTQSPAHGGVGVIGLMSAGCFGGMTGGGFCGSGGGFGFGLGEESLLANLFGGAMPQLRAILSARGGEVAILCAVEVGPGVENGYIFRGLGYGGFIVPVGAARIHSACSYASACDVFD